MKTTCTTLNGRRAHTSLTFIPLLYLATATAALTLVSCTGDLAQEGKLSDHTKSYQTIDLSHMDVVLESPESFVVDPASGYYFISNVNGASDSKDDNGFIIKLDSNFNLIDNYFIDGRNGPIELHAPKGLYVKEGILYVCDIETVRAFSCETGKRLGSIDFTSVGASFLNDITIDEAGTMWVSDTYQNKIYNVDRSGDISVRAEIISPNGLCNGPDGAIYVVTWEASKGLWFFPSARLFRVSNDGSTEPLMFDTEFDKLDGIATDSFGHLIFSDYGNGVVYTFDPKSGELATAIVGLKSPAGISYDSKQKRILIPDFQGDLVVLKQI